MYCGTVQLEALTSHKSQPRTGHTHSLGAVHSLGTGPVFFKDYVGRRSTFARGDIAVGVRVGKSIFYRPRSRSRQRSRGSERARARAGSSLEGNERAPAGLGAVPGVRRF